MYFFLALSTIFNAITAFIVGFFTYRSRRDSKMAKVFAFQCFLIGCWAVLYFFPFFPHDKSLSLLSFHSLHMASNLITVTHLTLVAHLLKIYEEQKKVIWAGYIIHGCFWLFIPTTWFIADVVPKLGFTYWPEMGPAYHVWMVSWSFFMLYSTWLLWTHYKKSEGLKKQQIKAFLFGTLIGLASGSTNFLPFYGIDFPHYLNILASFYVGSIAYLIARYRFFNLKLNLLRFAHKTLSFVLAFASLYLVYFYVNYFFPIPQGITTDIGFLLVALTFYYFFEMAISMKYFSQLFRLSDHEKFCETLEKFIKKNHFDTDLAPLKKRIKSTFIKSLKLESAELILITPKIKKMAPRVIKHFTKTKSHSPIILSEIKLQEADENKSSSIRQEIEKIGELVLPIYNSQKQLIAFLSLGQKPYNNPFYTEEIKIIKDVGYYLSMSLSVINYHEDLAKEVTKKTRALRQKNQQLKDSYEQLQKLDNVKDEFLSIASHELRTPLSIIKGYTDFLRLEDFGKLNHKQHDFIEKILTNTNDLITLINKMLDISRLESGQMSFYPEKIDLINFIKNVQEEFGIVYQQKNLKLKFSNPERLKPEVFLDREKLNIIFTNLLGNAYKFTPEGQSVSIKIESASKQKQIRVSVIDQGIGIPKDKQELIFNKFQQAENHLHKMHSGTGLGLNITRIIVEKFGGKIWVESEDKIKSGSTFIFTLPYTKR